MPELPEVETVRAGLVELIIGSRISHITYDNDKSFPNSASDVKAFLCGATITNVRRRAKVLLIDLTTNYTLVVHLKMTGQLVFVSDTYRFGAGHPNESLVGELPDRSTRVTLTLSNGVLYFNDQRKFGWVKLIPTPQVKNLEFFKKVGPEPLSKDFTSQIFVQRLQRRKNTTIKAAILDQTVLAGIGNIYADEGLWGAAIHPASRVGAIPEKQLEKLFSELQYVLRLSIEKGGSTDKHYVNAEGKKGSYLQFARVFRRENLPCPRCGTTIIKLRVAGRGTHICPKEQQLFVLP